MKFGLKIENFKIKKEITAVNNSAIGNDHHTISFALSLKIKINDTGTSNIINLSKDIMSGETDFLYACNIPWIASEIAIKI